MRYCTVNVKLSLQSWQTTNTQRVSSLTTSVSGRRFADKVVVITGAAGDIGGATAEAFAREGANLVLVDLPNTASKLAERCEQLQTCGAQETVVVSADLTKEEEVQAMVTRTVETMGKEAVVVPVLCNIKLYFAAQAQSTVSSIMLAFRGNLPQCICKTLRYFERS